MNNKFTKGVIAMMNIQTYSLNRDMGWSGTVLYGDGDRTSFEGVGSDAILMDCAAGQTYSVTFQKESEYGHLYIKILGYDKKSSTNAKVIETGDTYASYGIVGLTGKC